MQASKEESIPHCLPQFTIYGLQAISMRLRTPISIIIPLIIKTKSLNTTDRPPQPLGWTAEAPAGMHGTQKAPNQRFCERRAHR